MGKIKPLVLCLCFVLLFSAFCFGVFAENEGDSPLTESVAEAESESVLDKIEEIGLDIVAHVCVDGIIYLQIYLLIR